jgi:hypothetical protein
MPVAEFHRKVASIALRAAAAYGFALGGGNALIWHGIVDRLTDDVDLFTNRSDGVALAAAAVESALVASGLQAERQDKTGGLADIFEGMGDEMAEWLVSGPEGDTTTLQMAYIDRCKTPLAKEIGPVLDLEDVVGSKVCALASRVATRDYIDVAAALRWYDVDQLISLARRLDPGLTDREFADAGSRLDDMSDEVFERYGFRPAEVAQLRRQFVLWPRA